MSVELIRSRDLAAAGTDKGFALTSSSNAGEAAQKLIGHLYVVTACPDDHSEAPRVDLRSFRGRKGLLIPANTPDARALMHFFAARLLALGCDLRWTDTSGELLDWDVTSWEGSPDDFIAWAKARTKPYEPPQEPAPEMPPVEFPPEATSERPAARKRHLYAVDGNAALAPEELPVAAEPLSEDAFADEFAARYKDDWRHVEAWGRWFYWNDAGWVEDRESRRITPMRDLVREVLAGPDAARLTPDGKRKISRMATYGNSIRLAGTHQRISTTPEQWDADPFLLGVPGGVIDLKTGQVLQSSREQCISMRCSVVPQPGTPTLWLKMLGYWLGGDEDVIGFLRRFLGYALTGDNREQCMAFFYGPAQAGKGTILRTIAGIMGSTQGGFSPFRSYHYEAPIATFLESKNERHSTELAALYGKRLITSEEPSAGAKWDEGRIKWITGGSQITARFMARDNFSFTMTGKIIVAANHRPRLGTTDKAIKRRMHVVPFEHPIADEDRDNDLDRKLREEWPRILDWMIQGCMEWQTCGLGLPEKIEISTENYLESEDTLGAWLDECCERKGSTEGKALYEIYRMWCDRNGEHALTRRGWGNALEERGFGASRRGTGGVRMVDGLQAKLGAGL